jgi:hypothetical protein
MNSTCSRENPQQPNVNCLKFNVGIKCALNNEPKSNATFMTLGKLTLKLPLIVDNLPVSTIEQLGPE